MRLHEIFQLLEYNQSNANAVGLSHGHAKMLPKRKPEHAARFDEQQESLCEINFNDASVIKSVLDAPISCGFEAETVWMGIQGDPEEYTHWYQVENEIESADVNKITDSYTNWIMEEVVGRYEEFLVQQLAKERIEDPEYIDRFVDDMVSSNEIANWKEYYRDNDSNEFAERQEDGWTDGNWARDYVEENRYSDLEEYIISDIRDNGEVQEEAWEKATSEYSMDDWIESEFSGDLARMLADHGVYPSVFTEGGLDAVSGVIQDWAEKTSRFDGVKTGSYHSTDPRPGQVQDYWRVEDDGSIRGDGEAAEIISPVYDTPREMLREMNALFELFEANNVETNESTGLHVTMSMVGKTTKVNPLKLVLLLGDRYALQQFNRRFNTYSESQLDILERKLESALEDPDGTDDLSFRDFEAKLNQMVDHRKFVAANFQNKENPDGNKLIEFRIGGGNNYHKDFRKATQAVVRYAATMQAAHDPEAYREDYIKALYKIVQQAKEANKRDIDPAAVGQLRQMGLPNIPLVDFVIKHSKLYPENVENLAKLLNSKSKQITDEKRGIGARIIVNLIGEIRSKNIAAVGTPQEIRAFKSLFRMSGVKISDILNSDRLNRNTKESFMHFLKMKDPTAEPSKELIIPKNKAGFMLRHDYRNMENLPDPNGKIRWVPYSDYSTFSSMFSDRVTDQQKTQLKQNFYNQYGFIPGEPGRASDDEYVSVDLTSPRFIEKMRQAGLAVVREK